MDYGVLMVRLSKIAMTGGLALFAMLVTFNNIVDYGSNWAFVQHVMMMDTTFPDSTLRVRDIDNEPIQSAAYAAIITTEGLICLAFLYATFAMLRTLSAPKAVFQRAKSATAAGILLAFSLWFTGFMAIGGEWFAMWQSEKWNGQTAAFYFCMTTLAAGIYIFLDTDGEPSAG